MICFPYIISSKIYLLCKPCLLQQIYRYPCPRFAKRHSTLCSGYTINRDKRDKRNIMCFAHKLVLMYIIFSINSFKKDLMLCIVFFNCCYRSVEHHNNYKNLFRYFELHYQIWGRCKNSASLYLLTDYHFLWPLPSKVLPQICPTPQLIR